MTQTNDANDAKDTTPTRTAAPPGGAAATAPVILAVGAPAGETGSLVRVLAGLPADAGIAVVLAVQHREAFDEAGFRRALGERAGALADIADGAAVEAGRVYLPGPDPIVTVQDGRFRTRPADQGPGGRAAIDTLLVSLAQDQDGHTIGLVLAGTGGDGTLGLSAVKEAGGLTLVEAVEGIDPAPPAAANGPVALADFVLPAGEIAGCVALHARHLTRLQGAVPAGAHAAGAEAADALAGIAAVLLKRTGHDFHGYKRPTFLRRVQRRMQVVGADTLDAYLDALHARPDEAQQLFNDLLIGVTRFFRDPREFEVLERAVVPRLFEGKGRGDQVRVWVLGCSTGEEAYSIAILLREHAATLDAPPGLQIFATDLDGRALAVARAGRYPASIAADVSPERLARWFVEEGATYTVARDLRDACVFSQHSLIKDTPFSRLDLVSCRNLLIYLGPELQQRVIPLFHFALGPGGHLFLGASEGVARHTGLFAPVERGARIFRKIETGRRVLPEIAAAPYPQAVDVSPPRARPRPPDPRLARRAERLAERHAPAYAVVDEGYDVLHFSPRAGRYIHPAGGAASLNLLDLVHADLRLHLRAVLAEAAREARTARADGVPMAAEEDAEGRRSAVDLVVEPVPDDPGAPRGFVVLFKDGLPPPGADERAAGAPAVSGAHVLRLEAELRATRERLQVTIEQLEATNEELRSSNEEYQSLNEELQSANEELATSKEELQSLNEELTTVNYELAHRVDELGRVNSDLKNLLQATRIATVFLDGEARVTNFTPAAAEVFHLVESDLGRPISHIKSRVAYDGLHEDVRRVLRSLAAVEREVEEPGAGTRYIARVLPYRTVDNVIAGAVVTFTDVTPLARAQERLRESEARLRLVTERIPQLVWTAVGAGAWSWVGPQWTEYTGRSDADSRGRGWLDSVHPEDRAAAEAAWAGAVAAGALDVEYRVRAADGAHRWFHSRAAPLARGADEVEWFGTSTDVHEMRELRDRQGVLVAELQHRTRNLIAVVHSLADKTMAGSADMAEFRERFRDRLSALSRVQGLLSRLTGGERVTFDGLIRVELTALGAIDADGRGPQVELDGPAGVRLRSSSVQTFALALHELATNAVKHGALSRPEGRLRVAWRVEAADGEGRPVLHVDWQESGVPMPEHDATRHGDAPPRRGYGRELIERALPYQLKARTRYDLGPDGVRCSIALPISTERDAEHTGHA